MAWTWQEEAHARDAAGKFAEMAGSAPEGGLRGAPEREPDHRATASALASVRAGIADRFPDARWATVQDGRVARVVDMSLDALWEDGGARWDAPELPAGIPDGELSMRRPDGMPDGVYANMAGAPVRISDGERVQPAPSGQWLPYIGGNAAPDMPDGSGPRQRAAVAAVCRQFFRGHLSGAAATALPGGGVVLEGRDEWDGADCRVSFAGHGGLRGFSRRQDGGEWESVAGMHDGDYARTIAHRASLDAALGAPQDGNARCGAQ